MIKSDYSDRSHLHCSLLKANGSSGGQKLSGRKQLTVYHRLVSSVLLVVCYAIRLIMFTKIVASNLYFSPFRMLRLHCQCHLWTTRNTRIHQYEPSSDITLSWWKESVELNHRQLVLLTYHETIPTVLLGLFTPS